MAENNQTATTAQPKETKSERYSRWLVETGNALGRIVAPIAFVLIIAAVSMYAWDQIETLFRTILAQRNTIVNVPVSHFAAAASVGMALVMLAVSKYAQHAAVRAAATIWSVVYIAVSFLLVFIAWGLSATANAGIAASKNVALQSIVSDASSVLPFLPLIGSAAVVVLASLGLACFGVLVGASKNAPDRFETENRARGHLIGNFAKVVVSLASVGFSIWFGVTVLGVNAALAALLGLVLDIGLINSWSKSESAAEGEDMDEAARWRGWAYVFGFSVALMAVESVGTQFKTSAAQGNAAVSPQLADLLNSPVFGLMQAVGAVAIIGAIGLSIVQLLLTMRPIKKTATPAKDGTPPTPFVVRTATRIGEIGKALKGEMPATAALPAPLTLNADGVNTRLIGTYVFKFDGQPNYDQGAALNFAGELLGEVGMKAHYNLQNKCVNLRLWLFDKMPFKKVEAHIPDGSGKRFTLDSDALTANAVIEAFSLDEVGAVKSARVAVTVLSKYPKSPLPPERREVAHTTLMTENDKLAGNVKVSPAGVPYSETQGGKDEVARGYPTQAELEAHRKWVEDNAKK